MSLQLAAQHLASKGRGRDTRLIHVSPRELQGLQALAKAKGGSLTINPDTGLPEAGFLEDVLPIAATAALMFTPGGQAAALGLGGALGAGGGALAAGIGTGLLAGGASLLGQALSGNKLNLGKAATTGLLSGVAGSMGPGVPTSDVVTPVKALEAASAVPAGAGSGAGNVLAYDSAGLLQPANYAPEITGATSFSSAPPTPDKSFFGNLTGKEKLGYGLAGTAALSLLGQNNQQSNTNQDPNPAYIRPYTFSQTRNPQYGEPGQSYYKQSYTALPAYPAAGGGLMSAAMYPQSGMDKTQYATPTQMPTSAEVIRADYDAPTNPYNGEPLARFAEGGETKDAVKAYNDILAKRATEEYVNAPLLAAFRSAPQQAQAQAPATPDMGGGVKGLYQYYLGRQPSEAEIPQYADQIRSTGMATPEEAAYFRQFIGGEQAATGFKPTGPDPFGAQGGQGFSGSGMMGSGLMDAAAQQRGMPMFAYNPQTRQYSSTGYMQPPIDMMAPMGPVPEQANGAAGGLMPNDLVRSYDEGGRTEDDESYKDRMKRIKKMISMLDEVKETDRIAPPDLGEYVPTMKEYKPSKLNVMAMPQAFVDAPQTKGVMGRVGGSYALDRDTQLLGGLSGFAGKDRGALTVRPSTADVGIARRMGPGILAAQYERSLTGQQPPRYMANYSIPYADGGDVQGYNLGGYSDGGRMLKGPGDGMSDSIPGVIGGRQPARLADGEFVVPADVVSHLGNGSTDAGAKKLYAMMDKVRHARVGTKKQGKQIKAEKYLPK
jgi:hypothetical protein